MIKIIEVDEITERLYRAFQSLIPQLTTSGDVPTQAELQAIVEAEATSLWIAIDEKESSDQIVGTLTLVSYRIPTGYVARIEDVVVEQDIRRQGIGGKLVRTALEHARQAGVKAVDLTSNPARVAANQMYAKLGFEKRNTNLFRYQISDQDLEV
jgi:ribosomal protein S18 acetylase RimI-like enzyme